MSEVSRRISIACAATLLAFVPSVPAQVTSPPPVRYGLDYSSMQPAIDQGIKPAFASFWVGPWTKNDWPNFDRYLQRTGTAGVTPFIMWYYWGDDIKPSCVENGCHSSLHATQKTRSDWNAMAQTLADHVRQHAGGRQVLIAVESEFNKGGIDSVDYAPKFDQYLQSQMQVLSGVPGVELVIGFGNWGRDKWTRFPLAIQEADYIGFQAMSGMTRDSLPQYMQHIEAATDTARHIQSRLSKPSVLTDLAASSYTEPIWRTLQDIALRQLFERHGELSQAGVRGIIYRSLRDVKMDVANYYGYAEQYWGLQHGDGASKPSFEAWKALVQGKPLPPRVFSLPLAMEAEEFYSHNANYVAEAGASNHYVLRLSPGHEIRQTVDLGNAGNVEWHIKASAVGAGGVATLKLGSSELGQLDFGSTQEQKTLVAPHASGQHLLALRNAGAIDLLVDWVGGKATTSSALAQAPTQSTTTTLLSSLVKLQPFASHYREVEKMATKSTGGSQARGDASGGAVWNLWSNGYVQDGFSTYRAGSFEVQVTGFGQAAASVYPSLAVTVNDQPVGTLVLKERGIYKTVPIQLPVGTHTVRVAFTNDAMVQGQDRNAILDRVGMVHRS